MGLNSAGLTALLNDGNEAVTWAAAGDGPTAADQVSAARTQLTWSSPVNRVISAGPASFTGTPGAAADHLLLFSAASGGTFYGFVELIGDVVFGASGQFRIEDITLTGSDPGSIEAPNAPFALGTEVGVPTGTSLTASSGLGVNDGTEMLTLTDPFTGEENTFEVTVFRRRRWTSTINLPVLAPGVAYLFDECELNVTSDNFCVDLEGVDTNGREDYSHPSVIFRRCSFDGESTTGKCLVGGYTWVEGCDLRGTEDGWSGLYWSTIIDSNVLADTDGGPDPHSDSLQSAGIGRFRAYHCWIDAGDDSAAANAPVRIGTEFSAVTEIDIRYCGLAGTQHGLQMRGDAGAGDITDVTVIGCRWVDEQIYGPTDFQEVTDVTWIDNAFFSGEVIPSPV
jgi:hypothetical protein